MQPYQDWKRVTFQGPVGKPKKGEQAVTDAVRRGEQVETIRKKAGNKNRPLPENLRKIAEATDVVPVAQLDHDFRIAMQLARTSAKLSQADLAKKINEKQSIVNDYENGRGIPNPHIIQKIERTLGVKLPRPAKPQD